MQLKLVVLTRTTSGSCVIAWPLVILIGNIFPLLSIVFTRVSSPSNHIWATSRPTFTRPPCNFKKKEYISYIIEGTKYYSRRLSKMITGLFRRSSMYDWTP